MSSYPVLSLISFFLKIFSFIEAAIGIYIALSFSSSFGGYIQLASGIGILVGALLTYAFAELIKLGIDIGENTWRTAVKTERLLEEITVHLKKDR